MHIKCQFCSNIYNSSNLLIKHLKNIHKNRTENYCCKWENCNREYSNCDSFRHHLDRLHFKTIYNITNPQTTDSMNSTDNFELENIETIEFPNHDQNQITNRNVIEEINLDALKLIVSIYSDHSIARNKAGIILRQSFNFFQNHLKLNPQKSPIIDALIQPNIIPSEYMIIKQLREMGFFFYPDTFIINTEIIPVMYKKGLIEHKNFIKLFPLKEMFNALFNKTSIIYDIVNYLKDIKKLDSEFIHNIIQSSFWKNKLESVRHDSDENKKTLFLPIIIYFDDFEANNPLGSRSGIHKVGAVYIKIPCLPIHMTSKLIHIYAAMLFYTEDRKYKHFGNTRILRPLIDLLNDLQNVGIDLESNESFNLVRLIPLFVTGDNLGINSILGYNESFSSNYYCRFCKCKKEQSWCLCSELKNKLRNKKNYTTDLILNDNSQTGIKENSVFNLLENFHVTNNPAVDYMHDLLEGVFHYDLLLILNRFIIFHNFFSIETLNFRLKSFDYGPSVTINKPPQLSDQFLNLTKIKYSAAEMKLFFLNLPALIGDLVPENNEEWFIYLKLREIFIIVDCKSCHKDEHILLNSLIKEHHEMFIKCFEIHLRPKFHLLLHYGSVMNQIGPLNSSCSLRYESKHQEFKKTMASTTSRKNILQTMAIKHQYNFSNLILNYNELAEIIYEFGPLKIKKDFFFQLKYNFKREETIEIKFHSFVKHYGKYFSNDVVVQIGMYDDETPLFGIINKIFKYEDIVYFAVEELLTKNYDFHYCAYIVTKIGTFCSIPFNEIKNKNTSYINLITNNSLIVNWVN